jgi:CBS domain-containing protein
MTENRIRHLPILDGARLAGIVSIGDVVKAHLKEIHAENRYLRDYLESKYPG